MQIEIFFFTISSLRRELSPTRTLQWPERNRVQITCNASSAYHAQHVLRATWYEGTAQLWRQSLNRIYFSFIKLAEPLNRWKIIMMEYTGAGPESRWSPRWWRSRATQCTSPHQGWVRRWQRGRRTADTTHHGLIMKVNVWPKLCQWHVMTFTDPFIKKKSAHICSFAWTRKNRHA